MTPAVSYPAYLPAAFWREPLVETRWLGLATLWAAHGLLGLVMHRSAAVATMHAVATLLGVFCVALASSRACHVLCAAAYVAGAEVLWRMCEVSLFWELGKYAVTTILVVALLRSTRPRLPGRILLYFMLLLPSAVISYFSFGFSNFRRAVSFNLSGALALTMAVCFCSNARLTRPELRRVFLAFVTPIVGVAAIAVLSTYTNPAIRFTTESNFLTSGGFGPNQVSSVLGLGFVLVLLYLVQAATGGLRRLLLFGLLGVLAAQSAMTFSRNGLAVAVGALLAGAPFVAAERGQRRRLLGLVVVAGILGAVLVLPALDAFTGGKLTKRFQDTELSHRETYFAEDLNLWLAHPLYGVGVGISRFGHSGFAAPHTELSRLLAEHGLLGAAALLVLVAAALRRFRTAQDRAERAFLTVMLVWSFLYMTVNALRLAAPGLVFGLAFLGFLPDRPEARSTAVLRV